MTRPAAELWTTHELPGIRWDPADEPDDEVLDEARLPHDLYTQGLRGGTRIHTIHVKGDLL